MSSDSAGSLHDGPGVLVLHGGLVPPADADWIAAQLLALQKAGAPRPRRYTVQCVDDRAMSELHRRHMNDPSTTDVLTFVDGDQADAAVCVDEARRRAPELGHELRHELLLYALHGLLHAGGMDDRTPAEFAAMHGEENRLLRAVGLGALFGEVHP
ncbi:MAG: rRNA maturation RNase YbeY [Planctomycetes bacterium]|nr:rRNA maturation RNase YbeY [Planctomycetota bacterium]